MFPKYSDLDDKSHFSTSLPNRFEFADHFQGRPKPGSRSEIHSSPSHEQTKAFPLHVDCEASKPRRKSESYSVSPTARSFEPQEYQFLPSAFVLTIAQYQEYAAQAQWESYQQVPPAPYFQLHAASIDKKVVLYKTEMCRTFEETGNCKYGVKCQFAHDPVEIRAIPRHPRYKTEICKTFWQLGNCPYGKRCCFIHTENELSNSSVLADNEAKNTSNNSQDVFSSVDHLLIDEIATEIINSRNSSSNSSPIQQIDIAQSRSSLKLSLTSCRRKSIIDDRIEELANMVKTCAVSEQRKSTELSSKDPEFNTATAKSAFELWSSGESASSPPEDLFADSTKAAASKYMLFDKSPGSRAVPTIQSDIWTSSSNNSPFLVSTARPATEDDLDENATASGSSSRSSQSRQHLLMEMINLLE